jgi:hypothetical protein
MILFPTAHYFGDISKDPDTAKSVTIAIAVIALWFFNIGLNIVQVKCNKTSQLDNNNNDAD